MLPRPGPPGTGRSRITRTAFFSTTSANYFLAQNQGAAFSTTSANAWLGTKSTTNLAEGSNLYFTDARATANFISNLAATTTDALAEGSTNKYYTDARVGNYLVGSTTLPALLNYWTKSGSNISYSAGHVGIGIASPTVDLDVEGSTAGGGVEQKIYNTSSSGDAYAATYIGTSTDGGEVGSGDARTFTVRFDNCNTNPDFRLKIVALGSLLVIGFMMHNLTEGIAIVAPIAKHKWEDELMHLVRLGLIAGGPTIIGAWIGGFAFSNLWSLIFLAVGAGAIVYVIIEITKHMLKENPEGIFSFTNIFGFLAGMLIMYATGLFVF